MKHYEPVAWWPIDEGTRKIAVQLFHAETVDENLWPNFEKPEVPKTGPLAVIAQFASTLAEKTSGQVTATVQPLPRSPDGKAFEFKLMVTGNPGTQITFFTATESPDKKIKIRGWEDEDTLIESDNQIVSFLQTVANSEETREAVERMMILAEELRRGARG